MVQPARSASLVNSPASSGSAATRRSHSRSTSAAAFAGLRLRGYIDRLDVSPSGEVRIVDSKTGTAPRQDFEARALFQMRFYALVLWRTRGTVPRQLQLIYLGNGEIVRYAPDEADLAATERKIEALWLAIERAMRSGDWRPRPSKLCGWCSHQPICPSFGGTPPPLPEEPEKKLDLRSETGENTQAQGEGPLAMALERDFEI